MQTVHLQPLFHNKEERIGIYFTYSKTINDIVKQMAGAKWSSTKKCWHVPCTKDAYARLSGQLKGKAITETGKLKTYLQQRKAIVPEEKEVVKQQTANMMLNHPLSKENLAAIAAYKNMLLLKRTVQIPSATTATNSITCYGYWAPRTSMTFRSHMS